MRYRRCTSIIITIATLWPVLPIVMFVDKWWLLLSMTSDILLLVSITMLTYNGINNYDIAILVALILIITINHY